MRYGLVIAAVCVLLGAAGCGSTSSNQHVSTSSGSSGPAASEKRAMNHNTRAYMNRIKVCQISVALVFGSITKGQTDIQLADNAAQARDTCDGIRSQLPSMTTDHFDDQAATGFYAVDRLKSGLNAVLAYIDLPQPSKLIEARDKLRDGTRSAAQAFRAINRRRKVYGLAKYSP